MGARHQPVYRVVVADSRAPRDGDFIETIGHYNPRTDPATVEINEEKAMHWLSVGAQPTDTTRSLLKQKGILARMAEQRTAAKAAAKSEA